jgi:hypothetical protein
VHKPCEVPPGWRKKWKIFLINGIGTLTASRLHPAKRDKLQGWNGRGIHVFTVYRCTKPVRCRTDRKISENNSHVFTRIGSQTVWSAQGLTDFFHFFHLSQRGFNTSPHYVCRDRPCRLPDKTWEKRKLVQKRCSFGAISWLHRYMVSIVTRSS